jgi:hypothetical protein
MGRISDRIRHLLARQVRGIVVWYDSEKAYGSLVKRLSFSKQQFSHSRTAFSAEQKLEPPLDFVTDDGRLKVGCDVPPTVSVSVPMTRADSDVATTRSDRSNRLQSQPSKEFALSDFNDGH